MLKYFRAAVFWLSFVIVTAALFSALACIAAYCRAFAPQKLSIHAHNIATLWGRALLRVTPGWSSEVRGQENLPRAGDSPVVIVANHQSAVDICALYLMDVQFRWLSKQEVFRIPMVGAAMRWAGYVPIRRGQKASHLAALEASRQWIRDGISMVFFPEGTRSLDGKLKEFKGGAFRLALDMRVAILPVVIRGTKEMLLKNTGFPNQAHLELEILPKLTPKPDESLEELTTRVRTLIADRLAARDNEQSSQNKLSMEHSHIA